MPAPPRLELDPDEVGPDKTYSWLTQVVVPRPIAWVSTTSAAGVDNVAPHSFFTVSSQHPPVVQFTSVGRKDSLRNIEETGEFVVNVVTEPLALIANETATDYPRDLDEFAEVGRRARAVRPRAPAPGRAVAGVAGVRRRRVPARSGRTGAPPPWCSGGSLRIAVSEQILTGGRVDVRLLRPVARLGGPYWATLGEVLTIHRKKYQAPPA